MTTNSITILGCGPSAGVPIIGYQSGPFWGACDSNNPKNMRSRSSAFVIYNNVKFLIDTSPDLRQQILKAQICDIDAVLMTHLHADHTHGINDLKALVHQRTNRSPISIYSNAPTLNDLQTSFSYLFVQKQQTLYSAILQPHVVKDFIQINDVIVKCFEQDHGDISSLGFRFGSMAYSTDFKHLNNYALEQLRDLDLWIVDCLSCTPKPTHNHLDAALEWIERVAPKRAILTHMGQELDYQTLINDLPPHIIPAYDGLVAHF